MVIGSNLRIGFGVVLLVLGSALMFESCGIRKKEAEKFKDIPKRVRSRTDESDITAFWAFGLFYFSFKVLKGVYDEAKAHREGRNDQWT